MKAHNITAVTDHVASMWSSSPPDAIGFWWIYGDEEFGTMGGNYNGTIPADQKLDMVEVRKISNGLIGVCKGRMISLRPFDGPARKPGYVGVWQRATLPVLPHSTPGT